MSTMTIRIASSSALLLVLCILSLAGVRGFHLETTYIHQKTALLTPSSSFRPHHAVQEQQGSGLSSKRSSSTSSNRHRLRHQFALYASSSSHVNGKANDDYDEIADVLVIGSGPAARAIASLLSANNNNNKLNVILADKNVHRTWPPNYGVWQDEWQAVVDRYSALGVNLQGGRVGKAIDYEWSVTDCYFGGSFDIPTTTRMRLDRPYYRVDRDAVRDSLTPPENGDDSGRKMAASSSSSYKILRANHKSRATSVNVYEPAGSLVHDSTGTTVQLETVDNKIVTVRSKLVIDCTGHETDLVLRESRDITSNSPGFQIAYGCLVDIDEAKNKDLAKVGPYAKEAMTLFDYRTDHYDDSDDATRGKVAAAPTFMYAMPLGGNQIFFEETSLVARPGVSFQECKDRCFQRLEYHGIKVTKIHEEEYCYIPMGGALPAKDQRVLALGGSAAMVHPATGYHLCRCLMGAADMAETIIQELAASSKKPDLDMVAAAAYHSIWSPENIRQRNFSVFGGEFLMKQNVAGLRGFFDGFFRLPQPWWAGFLAGWPGLPNNDKHETWYNRMLFGLQFIVSLPLPVAFDLAASIVMYMVEEGVPLPQSVTPLLGEPFAYAYKRNNDKIGDVAAKTEARRMITSSKIEQDLPVAFGQEVVLAEVVKEKVVEKSVASVP